MSCTHHSHLIAPPMAVAFFAGIPHEMTCPYSSYSIQVGILRNVSKEPGQLRICCTFPAAMRDDPYA